MEQEGAVKTEAIDGVLRITLSRSDKRNSLTPGMMRGLADALDRLQDDALLRVGVLSGEGGNFTSGLDLMRFVPVMSGAEPAVESAGIDPLQLRQRCTKPLIAAVSGYVFTVGIELLLACDIAVAGDDSVFAQLETTRGIMVSGGGTVRWVQRCGWGDAMRWMLTGERFGADEALRIGLVQEVVPTAQVVDRALALAHSIAANAPLAVQETKRSALRYLAEGEDLAFAALGETQAVLVRSADAMEGVAAMMEKRSPEFKGR